MSGLRDSSMVLPPMNHKFSAAVVGCNMELRREVHLGAVGPALWSVNWLWAVICLESIELA